MASINYHYQLGWPPQDEVTPTRSIYVTLISMVDDQYFWQEPFTVAAHYVLAVQAHMCHSKAHTTPHIYQLSSGGTALKYICSKTKTKIEVIKRVAQYVAKAHTRFCAIVQSWQTYTASLSSAIGGKLRRVDYLSMPIWSPCCRTIFNSHQTTRKHGSSVNFDSDCGKYSYFTRLCLRSSFLLFGSVGIFISWFDASVKVIRKEGGVGKWFSNVGNIRVTIDASAWFELFAFHSLFFGIKQLKICSKSSQR